MSADMKEVPPQPPILVLGMHRSGTSCLAGLLVAAGATTPGPVVRNWDNARGHFEATVAVRLNEAVLARSGGHWLKPPAHTAWDAVHAAERDRLLAAPGTLLKDPRTLLVLPFWLAAAPPPLLVGIVRHPLAVARSLLAWRQMPLAEGVALWTAHNRALLAAQRAHGFPLLDFDQPAAAFLAAVAALLPGLGLAADDDTLRAAYAGELVHHDGADGELDPAAAALHRELLACCGGAGVPSAPRRTAFPWVALRAVQALCASDPRRALELARGALAGAPDPAAVAVPLVAEFLRHRCHAEALALIDGAPALPVALAGLLAGKVQLAAERPALAVPRLEQACAAAHPPWEARHLLSQALRRAGQRPAARAALAPLVADALYPHRILGTLAEWTWEDGERPQAIDLLAQAIAHAPDHRRGRLRTRRAQWLRVTGDPLAAAAELELIAGEDPAWVARGAGGGDRGGERGGLDR